jgi:poly [ADP-ribose] polymerase
VPSMNKNGPLEYNEYAVYDPKQVRCFCSGWLINATLWSCPCWPLPNCHRCKQRYLVLQVSICFLVGVKYEEQNMEVVPDDEWSPGAGTGRPQLLVVVRSGLVVVWTGRVTGSLNW